jgi:hypothetical protein
LIKETASENFSERRVNLLKAHILHLERQVALLSNGMDTQVQLLSDLQVYGDSLQHKLKSLSLENESLLKDIQHLTKLNKRLKEVIVHHPVEAASLMWTPLGLFKVSLYQRYHVVKMSYQYHHLTLDVTLIIILCYLNHHVDLSIH